MRKNGVRMTVRFNEETIEKLEKLAEGKYRNLDKTKVIRWLIEDAFEIMVREQKMVIANNLMNKMGK